MKISADGGKGGGGGEEAVAAQSGCKFGKFDRSLGGRGTNITADAG